MYVDGVKRSAATDAAAVAATLGRRTDVSMTDPTAIELGGRDGLQFDLTTTAPKTPLFYGPAGDFRLEPAFKTRYRVLDFPVGGILVIGVHSPGEGFDAAVASRIPSRRPFASSPRRKSDQAPRLSAGSGWRQVPVPLMRTPLTAG